MTEKMKLGGWSINPSLIENDIIISKEVSDIFDEAVRDLDGVGYSPFLYCGRQLVAGNNYMFIARQTLVLQTPIHHVVKMVIYKPLEGKAVIHSIETLL